MLWTTVEVIVFVALLYGLSRFVRELAKEVNDGPDA